MKDLNYWKNNCEEDYINTPISVFIGGSIIILAVILKTLDRKYFKAL